MEEWRKIEDSNGFYEVSSCGRVRSLDHIDRIGRRWKGKVLPAHPDSRGMYLHVIIWRDGKFKPTNVHRLVAKAFIPNPDCLPEVNHKDEDKRNNRAENLEWCTHRYNNNYGSKPLKSRGENNSQNRIPTETVKAIKREYVHRDKERGVTALANKYGISVTHVCAIVKGRRWADCKP